MCLQNFSGDEPGDNTCDKVGGETNVIVPGANNKEIAKILIAAWPPYVRDNGRFTTYRVPTWLRQPKWAPMPRYNSPAGRGAHF
jgi:hypothetical protein